MDRATLASPTGAEWIARPLHQELRRKERPVLPPDDPFYQPPPGFEHALPGTVLRSRDVELAFLGLVPQRATATQLLYRTTDMNGKPEAAVTTVIVPAEVAPGQPCPLLSYQCAIDAVASRCFPSYALRRYAKAIGALAPLEFLLITAALAEGWAVSVPDHEGRHGMWGAPYQPGYCILDGVRAALGSERTVLSPSAPVALWGYSGGGLATAWAAEVCADYAPELDIVGAVLGSPVGDLAHTFRRLNGGPLAGLPALVIAALAHVYPDLDRVIKTHTNEAGRALLRQLEDMTTVGAVIRMAGKNVNRYLDRPLEEILEMPEVQDVFDNIKLGTAVPAPPILIVQAVHDYLIAVEDIDALADAYSGGGADVTYHRDAFNEHLLLHPLSAPMTLRWLQARFARRPLNERRLRTTWPTLFNPATYIGMARLGVIAAKVLTGRPVHRRPL
ncbi:lipase [Mycobacterium heckeshornense]|uniref:Lipase n=1 Tax=Mycobacterium heckeshornense TaxID=110505 RepID=A0A2G8BB94_9MYCO|nr:lipase family protein [Mycobacterium heckeshornense]KMV18610.1 lipase [Mycobacterium heckeshornense]MCV7035148.1 lipase [Mycobacterium heckeshornense]PIJ34936.1 lipase [Mycobacterium heckeshornense]BCO36131.1 lipase [Mycobacterium heckeshornense]